jgi:hypothetical protein
MGLVCAEHVFTSRPGKSAKVRMQIREDADIGRHFPEGDIPVDNLAQVFQIVGGFVLGRIKASPEILSQLVGRFFAGRALATAEKCPEMGLDCILLVVFVTLTFIA